MTRVRDTSRFLDWDAPRFLYELRRRGLTWKDVSAMAEPPISGDGARKAVSNRWKAAEVAISRALGIAPELIWPSRYPAKRDAA